MLPAVARLPMADARSVMGNQFEYNENNDAYTQPLKQPIKTRIAITNPK